LTNAGALSGYAGIGVPAVARKTTAERLSIRFLILGIAASLIAFFIFRDAVKAQAGDAAKPFAFDVSKPLLFYVIYAIQLAFLLGAGVAALISTNWRAIERGYFARMALFFGASLLMTLRGYSASDLFSTRLADWTGPLPCFISVLVFIGARRSNWRVLEKILYALAISFCAMTVWGFLGLRNLSREEGVLGLTAFLNALYWPAAWMLLKSYPRDSVARRFRFGPIALYAIGTLFTQTRLNAVMLLALLLVYTWVQRKRGISQTGSWIAAAMVVAWLALFTAIFLTESSAFEAVQGVANAFTERLDQDTRSGQLLSFADNVNAEELILGRGSLASWSWPGMSLEWRGGTDVGYLTLLFYGGIPLLLTYIAVHLLPAFRVLRRSTNDFQLIAAAIVMLWALRMLSSSYPGPGVEYYPVLFFVGACVSQARPKQRFVRGEKRF
jgi:hypothetical protein